MALSLFHFLVNIFAGGRSLVKVGLFAVFSLLVFTIFFWPKNFSSINHKKIRVWFFGSVSFLYIWGLFILIYFSSLIKIPLNEYVLVIGNGEISSNIWHHSHLMKGTLAVVLSNIGVGRLDNIDAGIAFLGLVNEWILLVGFMALAISLILLLLFLFSIKQKLRGVNMREKIILFFLCSVSLFSLVKTALDGGIFHPDALISALVIIFITRYLDRSRETKDWLPKNKMPAITLAISLLGYVFMAYDLPYYITTSYLYLIISSIGILLILKASEVKYFIALFFIFGFFASTLDRNIWAYENLEIKRGESVQIFSYKKPTGIFQIKKELGTGQGYIYEVEPAENTTVGNLIKNIGSTANLAPVAIPWRTCIPTQKNAFVFNLQSRNPLAKSMPIIPKDFGIKLEMREVSAQNNWHKYFVRMEVSNCVPRVLNIFDDIASANFGNQHYLLTNFALEEQ